MASIIDYRQLALKLPGVTEVAHFEKRAFRTKRKIFATLLEVDGLGIALLTPEEQYIYCKMDDKNIYPLPNKWGLAGATYLNVKSIKKSILKEILLTAYQHAL
jgi:predicted DNA-binding protein (MmcQ/YjbR family)